MEGKLSKAWNHKLQCSKIVLGKEPVSISVSLFGDIVKISDAERNEPWKLKTLVVIPLQDDFFKKSHNLLVFSVCIS